MRALPLYYELTVIDEVTRWSTVCLAGGDCRLFRRCYWVWLGVDQVTYFGDGIDRVIGWWQFGGELSASPNPCGSHSEAFGSVYVGCRAVPDEYHLLRAGETSGVNRYPKQAGDDTELVETRT